MGFVPWDAIGVKRATFNDLVVDNAQQCVIYITMRDTGVCSTKAEYVGAPLLILVETKRAGHDESWLIRSDD